MIFTHDTELTLRAACALINSDRADGEQMADLPALDAYLDGFRWTGRRDHDAAELKSIHRLRERLAKIWEAANDEERAVGRVNALLQRLEVDQSFVVLENGLNLADPRRHEVPLRLEDKNTR